jgi:hypothetical protein
MIALRMLSLLAGAAVLVVPPMLLGAPYEGELPPWVAVMGLVGLTVMAGSFFYVGVLGDRMRRPGHIRTLGGLLLMIPAVAAVTMLGTRNDPALLWCSGALLAFTVLLFISFVYPAAMDRRQRPMRLRERHEPVLSVVRPRQRWQ